MLAVAQLLIRPPASDRSKVITQTKRDNLVLHIGGCAWGLQPHPIKKYVLLKSFYKQKPDGKFWKR